MKAVILAFAIFLGGCGHLGGIPNPVGPNTLAATESAYGIALSAAVGYRNACARRVIAATCRPIVARLQQVGRVAQVNVLAARRFIRENPTLDASSLIAAASASVQAFRDVQIQYGVQ